MGKQKRSKNTYQKINTIFKRDTNNIIMPYSGLVDPVLEFLQDCKFECSEKVDGTNVRFEVVTIPIVSDNEDEIVVGVGFDVYYKGKTDNANLPKLLEQFMKETYPPSVILSALGLKECISTEEFGEYGWNDLTDIPAMYTIYGEGYGVKIQGCGGNYLKDSNKVIGFDVKVTSRSGKEIYLLNENRDAIMNNMNMPIVPTIGYFTIKEAIEFVQKGFKSRVAESNPEFLAEGLVCKTPNGLLDRQGNRIVFKVKTCDWDKYYAKYGTYDQVEQEANNKYNDQSN